VIEVRSYRRVFDLERRIYSIDRLRLNPGGVPVRAVLYFLAILSTSVIGTGLPLVGFLVRDVPWLLRDIAWPAAAAAVLSAIRIEGRVFHLATQALVRYWLGSRHLAGTRRCRPLGARWRSGEILMLPDGSDARLRRVRYTGPGAVLVAVAHERRGRAVELGASGRARWGIRSVLSLAEPVDASPLDERQVISLGPGARMRVRSRSAEVD
jgi:hypothetical protein